MSLHCLDADQVRTSLPFERAMDAIEEALRTTVDPEHDGPRLFADAPGGEFLLMPAQGFPFCGVKALTVAPGNPARNLEKIQGVYVLFSSATLSPVCVMDGAALTAIRTPAVAMSAVRMLAASAAPGDELPDSPRVLVFGAGTQAHGTVLAARTAFPGARFEIAGRSPTRREELRARLAADGITVADRTEDRDTAVSDADVIVCATTTDAPLFDGALVRDGAIVAAIGTHGRHLREVDDVLVARSDVVVEGRDSAERENGNLATHLRESDWRTRPPANLRELALGGVRRSPGRPALYTGVGMSWEDLVCASAVAAASGILAGDGITPSTGADG